MKDYFPPFTGNMIFYSQLIAEAIENDKLTATLIASHLASDLLFHLYSGLWKFIVEQQLTAEQKNL